MIQDIREEIITCVREISRLDVENRNLSSDTRLIEDLDFDSFDLIKLVVMLEDSFNFSFADEDLLFETVNTIGGLVEYVENMCKGMGD